MESTVIYSVFGQIEVVAANDLIQRYGCRKIEADMIPKAMQYDEMGLRAEFAIILTPSQSREFERLIRQLYM